MDYSKLWSIALAVMLMVCGLSTRAQTKVLLALPLESIHINSPFGVRRDPLNHKRTRAHHGVDLRAHNDKVFAMMSGYVEDCGYSRTGGIYVKTRHGNIRCTYLHLSKVTVVKGQPLNAADMIGISGNTGSRTTGPHLHLQVQMCDENGEKFVNPMPMLRYIEENR